MDILIGVGYFLKLLRKAIVAVDDGQMRTADVEVVEGRKEEKEELNFFGWERKEEMSRI